MNARWLVAKHVQDLRRQETRNVGVVLLTDTECFSRFMGERLDGTLDGRRLRWSGSSQVFKAWVAYWRHQLESGEPTEKLIRRRADDSYFLVHGGERLLGEKALDPRSFLDCLYGTLVEEEPERDGLSVVELADTVLKRIGIREKVSERWRCELAPTPAGFSDSVTFDYRYENGVVSLMHRAGLVFDDHRSWDVAHSVAWDFNSIRQALPPEFPVAPQCITLARTRPADNDLERQLSVLRGFSDVVLLDSVDEASEQLGKLLHVVPEQVRAPGSLLI